MEDLLIKKWKACNFTDTIYWELTDGPGDTGRYGVKKCSVVNAARNPPNPDDCPPLKTLLEEEALIAARHCKALKVFRSNVVKCEDATRKWERKYILCESYYEEYEDQAEQCLKQEEWTRVRLCTSFGIEYQEKCRAYDNFRALERQIKNVTNATHLADTYSEPDRKAEWTAVAKVECMLRSYAEQPTPGFDKTSWAKCQDDGKYPHIMNYWVVIINGLMTAENFNCQEKHIKFYQKYIDRKRSSKAGEERFVSLADLYTDYDWGTNANEAFLMKLFAVEKDEEKTPFMFCNATYYGSDFTGPTGEKFKDKVVVNDNVQFKIGKCDNAYVNADNSAKFNTTKCSTTKCRDWTASVRQLECDQLQEKGAAVDIFIGSDPHGGANKRCVNAPAKKFGCARNAGHPNIRINTDFVHAPDKFNIYHANGQVCAVREDNTKNNGWGMKLKIRCYEGAIEVDSQADTRRVCVHGHWNKDLVVKCREYWQPDAHDVDGWMNTTRGAEPVGGERAAPNTY